MLVNHGPSWQSSKEEYKPWKWGATAGNYAFIQRSCYSYHQGSPWQDPATIGSHEDLLTIIKRCKLQWYGHVSCSSGLAAKGERRKGRRRKRWKDNIWVWTGLEFTKSQRAVKNNEKWRKLVVKSSVVPQWPSRLRDRWWWWEADIKLMTGCKCHYNVHSFSSSSEQSRSAGRPLLAFLVFFHRPYNRSTHNSFVQGRRGGRRQLTAGEGRGGGGLRRNCPSCFWLFAVKLSMHARMKTNTTFWKATAIHFCCCLLLLVKQYAQKKKEKKLLGLPPPLTVTLLYILVTRPTISIYFEFTFCNPGVPWLFRHYEWPYW